MNEEIKIKLANIPMEPGCYLMKDKTGEVIYVGKAKKLKNRVNQYFVGAHDFKTTKMVSNIDSFDFIVCNSEKEALLLEINLIKKYRPRFNIMFMDDKSYPYIRLTKNPYPLVKVVRDAKKDKKSIYFGPYPDATAAHKTAQLLQEIYPIRKCKNLPKKECLYYHMGLCLGPCINNIPKEEVDDINNKIMRFFKGDVKDIRKNLTEKMEDATKNLEYEKAIKYRDTLLAIDHILDKQQVQTEYKGELDVFAYYVDKGYIAIQGLFIRNGKLLEKDVKIHPLYGDENEEITSYIIQYYQIHPLPKELIVMDSLDSELLSNSLDCKVSIPQKGYRKKLVNMAINNAHEQLDIRFDVLSDQESKIDEAVKQFSDIFKTNISKVEIFDNSHISGTFTVASCVVYIDGKPSRKDYRHYRLHTNNSDTDSMKEVLYRRYFKIISENESLPDCILVDGGLNQINAAKEILSSLDIHVVLCGLVKDDKHNTANLMDENGNLIEISRDSSLFFLLTRMQDEAHRFAIEYHRKLRQKAQTKSILDEISGVGEVRKKKLLSHFKSFKNIKEASVEMLMEVVPEEVAKDIYRALHE